MMDKEKTKTVFRIYPEGEVIALFPQVAADNYGWLCSSYMHLGQHGGADTFCVVGQTKPATPKEYRSLLKELKQLGYRPKIAKRCTWYDKELRDCIASIRRFQNNPTDKDKYGNPAYEN